MMVSLNVENESDIGKTSEHDTKNTCDRNRLRELND